MASDEIESASASGVPPYSPGPPDVPSLWPPISDAVAGVLHGVVLPGAAAKALARLIGAGADVGVAKLKAIAEAIESHAANDKIFMGKLASAAANLAVNNPEMVASAANALFERNFSGYLNKVTIAARVVDELGRDDPNVIPSEGPSDDFMNLFGDAAERASSEFMQNLFARVLAGEIRRPGQFSLRTIQCVSIFDQPAAERTQRIKTRIAINFIPAVGAIMEGSGFIDLKECSYLGLLDQSQTGMHYTLKAGESVNLLVAGCHISVFFLAEGRCTIPSYWITEVGQQVFGLLPNIVDWPAAEDIARGLRLVPGVTSVRLSRRLDNLPYEWSSHLLPLENVLLG